MLINFSGLVTKKEYTSAFILHYSSMRILKWINTTILAIIVTFYIRLAIPDPTAWIPMLPPIILLAVVLSFFWWLPALTAAGYNKKGNVFHEPLNGTIDEAEVTIHTELCKASISWKGYVFYRHKGDLILLYQNKNCFNIFTRSMFTNDSDWEQFLALTGKALKAK